jgi:transglutaminase-like putative cysteine protease
LKKTGPTRIIRARTVTNGQLVEMVTDAAQIAANRIAWPKQLPRDRAPEIIHHYLRRHVRYKAEPPSMQIVRLPSATVKEGVADCKSTAVFLVAALRAAGWPVALRFIKQGGRSAYSHVYALADGVPVDPLLPFGQEPVYSAHKDVEIR